MDVTMVIGICCGNNDHSSPQSEGVDYLWYTDCDEFGRNLRNHCNGQYRTNTDDYRSRADSDWTWGRLCVTSDQPN